MTSTTTRSDVLAELMALRPAPPRPAPSLPAGLTSSPLLRAPLPLARVAHPSLEGLAPAEAFVGADVRDPAEHYLVCRLSAARTCYLALPLHHVDESALAGLGPAGLRDLVTHTDTCHLLEVSDPGGELESSQQFRHLQASARRLPAGLLPA